MAAKKTPNHALSEMKCPVHLADVDLFSAGAQEHWFEAYEILHEEAPVHRIPGDHGELKLRAISQQARYLMGVLNDVIVGQHVSRSMDQES